MKLPHRFGRYLLQERIGGGGMATVYRATFSVEGGFEKEVALKVIRGELSEDPQFIRMFLDEARLSGSLDHPNIVQTFDFGQVEGVYFLAMELVRGRTLGAILETMRENRLRLGTAASLFVAKELARALGYAHRAVGSDGQSLGVVHRDVSPQNVLISREGHVKLADFGIAKAALRSQVTQPGRVRGKCSYMAPEQARGLEVDARADVFALGAVLWECLVGRRLFDGPSDATVLLAVIEKEIPPPSQLIVGIPPEVDRVTLQLLERDPEKRPTSAVAYRELADLAFRLARSPEDLDLHHLQQRLASATAAVSRPDIELSTWRPSGEGAYPWAVDPDAETIVSEEEIAIPTRPLTPDDPTRSLTSTERKTQTLGGRELGSHTGEAKGRGRAMVPVAIASALGALLGIAAIFVWNPWTALAPFSNEADVAEEEPEAKLEVEEETPEPSAEEETIAAAIDEAPDEAEPKPAPALVKIETSEGSDSPPPPAPTPRPVVAKVVREAPPAPAADRDLASTRRREAAPSMEEAQPPPPAAPPPAKGTMVLSTRLTDVIVGIGRDKKETLSPLTPRKWELSAGEKYIHFQHAESGLDCSVAVEVRPAERLAILLDAQGVFELRGLERRPIPCR